MNIKIFNGNNSPHELLLTTRQSGGFLVSLLSKLVGPLMKVAVSLAKNILASLGITVADSAIVAGIQKKYMVLNNNSDNFK